METEIDVIEPLGYPNVAIVKRLLVIQDVLFMITGTISVVVLAGWLVPAVGSMLPSNWSLMKANTALVILITTISMKVTQINQSGSRLLACRIGGFLVLILAGTALLGHLTGQTFMVDTMLAADSGAEMPGRMSAQTASFFFLMGLTLVLDGISDRSINYVVDLSIALLIAIVLMVSAGYVFDASKFFGHSMYTRTSPHTLTCMTLLAFAACTRRTDFGMFPLFMGVGIGSQTARIMLPVALILPFLIVGGGGYLVSANLLSQPNAAAFTASLTSFLLIGLSMVMARKINGLEHELRDMSLIDELTQIYNRRGFYLLGEHMVREGRRDGTGVTVLFFDVDGLKQVNDTLGHDAGSNLLLDFANLLKTNFRQGDVVARVGGDEFAVASRQSNFAPALKRLDAATITANNSGGKPYILSYSVGEATTEEPMGNDSFDKTVARADALMYEHKQQKKASREAVYVTQSGALR
ncbi:MAG TPA: GGDEF domain-containing protein [Syntrophales bacterium]|nr:GGDEF domain-containing protein [Syntrophales bacterium]HPQ44132.1 GGDEF domain-containing protein [Syntrophales bacterium]